MKAVLALALLAPASALRGGARAPMRVSMDYVNPTGSGGGGAATASTSDKATILTESPAGKKQDFLEASPYWDQSTVPVNTYKNKSPYTTKVTTSLCVRRATYWDPEMGKDDPAKKGVCSNFICDSKPGDPIKMTGPSGKVMLMPEEKADTDYIMVATGTGIAPYRSFIRRLFTETTPAGEAYKGTAWLFLGVANSDALL
ncbi:NADPH-hemoprotein reductase [Aureococcus anophagefferens]|nr:NADPH-hemoprotein reductase [Aureococcus anophagefferens]